MHPIEIVIASEIVYQEKDKSEDAGTKNSNKGK
jgi:hypothetical protein